MIIPCIDLMGGKVVQLVQGREKALEAASLEEMLERFSGFPVIQVIDLDAAIGTGENSSLVEFLCSRARCRVGGGVRSKQRFDQLVSLGADRVIVGTSAFREGAIDRDFLGQLDKTRAVIALDSKHGQIVIKGWREALAIEAATVIRDLEPYGSGFLCTYVDKEGMMQGTDLAWFESLRALTTHEITAAGGITTIDDVLALDRLGIHAALGMAIYTGRLDLAELRALNLNT